MAITISHNIYNTNISDLYSDKSEIFEYKVKCEEDILLIKKHFEIIGNYSDDEYVYIRIDKQKNRKIKLLIIQKKDDYKFLKKILINLKNVSYEDILTNSLSRNISREIDKEIIKNIMNLK
jgi:hypothetical protein